MIDYVSCVYVLICPLNKKVRYVGMTTRHVEIRLKQHISKPASIYLKEWIEKLKLVNTKPEIKIVIAFNNYFSGYLYEKLLIAEMVSHFPDLLNRSDNPLYRKHPYTKKVILKSEYNKDNQLKQ